MVLQILLIISVLLQLTAAVIAVRLTRVTKYNSTWILLTAALVLLSLTRLGEYYQIVSDRELRLPPDFFVWMGVLTSLCFAVGVFFVRKIFNYIGRVNFRRRLSERRILSTVLRTEEKERMRFSKELHDGLGPLLSSAKMSLSALDRGRLSDEDHDILRNTTYVIEEAIRSLKEISNNLSPHILEDFGLTRAIGTFVSKCAAINRAIDFRFDTDLRAERFNTDQEVIFYRVVCELINNSIRHSGCRHVRIGLRYDTQTLTLDYSDDGCGFDPGTVMDTGMGLSNITSRINSLRGTVSIESRPGAGMCALITVNMVGHADNRQL